MTRGTWIIVALAIAVAGCSHPPAGELRFYNRAPVWRVNDKHPVAGKPAERVHRKVLYHVDGYLVRPATRWMDFQPRRRALDINALDEVPNSTWFTNRIGVRDMSIDELRRGPNRDASPFEHRPWKITSAKIGGTAPGFIIEDNRGYKYLLKFDWKDMPEAETAADVIVQRILWACGYNVAEDDVGTITRKDLVIAADATRKAPGGRKVKLTEADVDGVLRSIRVEKDGSIRVLVSRYVEGEPIGPYSREGTRSDDPNDVIPHERRRSLRGQYAIFSWLNHTDLQEDNTLDSYVADPDDPKRHYVVHYLIDFGSALGVMGAKNRLQTTGYTYRVDVEYALRALFALGMWKQPWDEVTAPRLRGVGLFESKTYDPGLWRSHNPYWPFVDKDRFDAFWGAKILIRFTPAQIAAMVEEGKLSDPLAAAYITQTLIERQRKTARYWFRRVAPLDRFDVTTRGTGTFDMCFDDLTLVYGLEPVAGITRYTAETYDRAGRPSGPARVARPVRGRGCIGGLVPGATPDGYTIVKIRLERGDRAAPPVLVHLARDRTGGLQVIGLRRR